MPPSPRLQGPLAFACAALLAWTASGRASGPATSEQANAYYQAGNWAESIKAYQSIVKQQPQNGRAWYRLAASHAQLKQYEKAVEGYLKAEAIGHQIPVQYNLACAYAQLGDTARAFRWLDTAADAGLRRPDDIRKDSDLEPLRGTPHFEAILARADFNERPCAHRSEHRRLDFWVGDWVVTQTSDGARAGTNRITLENNDCAIYEHWTGAQGGAGQSMNFFNPTTRKWHQSWVDDQGELAEFDGDFHDGAMRLEGYRQGPNGTRVPARLTLTPLPDGTVRQLGEDSPDGGKTWTTLYDLTYTKRP